MKIIQLVKRFGPVGGMEEYVWRLPRALAAREMAVTVVCEESIQDFGPGIHVEILGVGRKKPRWLGHINFARRVRRWLDKKGSPGAVLHSHELLPHADIFTFHSTPHGQGADGEWWRRLDPTWHINQWLEGKVVCSSEIDSIISVSDLLRQQISVRHPGAAAKCIAAIPPGVEEAPKVDSPETPVLGFLGREWKRKGLRRVMEIFRELHGRLPKARLVLGGMPPESVTDLVSGLESHVDLLGLVKDKEDFYGRISLLIHPARLEAFGMVVTEAMTRGIPVLVSSQTGAASEVDDARGQVLSLTASNEDWIDAAENLCNRPLPEEVPYQRSWDQVAAEYIEVYQKVGGRNYCN